MMRFSFSVLRTLILPLMTRIGRSNWIKKELKGVEVRRELLFLLC